MSPSCSRRPLLTHFVTVEGPTPLPFEDGPAVNAPAWVGVFSGFTTVAEEHKIPTRSRAVRPSVSGDCVAEGLGQQLSAAVALVGDVETLSTDIGEFGGGELHASPPFGLSSSLRFGEDWLRGGCGFCLTFPRSAELSCLFASESAGPCRLRIWSRKGWGFESPLSHQTSGVRFRVSGRGRQKAKGRRQKAEGRRQKAEGREPSLVLVRSANTKFSRNTPVAMIAWCGAAVNFGLGPVRREA